MNVVNFVTCDDNRQGPAPDFTLTFSGPLTYTPPIVVPESLEALLADLACLQADLPTTLIAGILTVQRARELLQQQEDQIHALSYQVDDLATSLRHAELALDGGDLSDETRAEWRRENLDHLARP